MQKTNKEPYQKNQPTNSEEEGTEGKQIKKRSYSYNDFAKMQSKKIYTSIGEMVDSRKLTAPKYGFGTANRQSRKKMLDNQQISRIDLAGQLGNGPASYFQTNANSTGKENSHIIMQKANSTQKFKYPTQPAVKIGTGSRMDKGREIYNYHKVKDDSLNLNEADRKRRKSQGAAIIGLDVRWKKQRKDRIIPGPEYDVGEKMNLPNIPKFTLGFKRDLKTQDPFINHGCTDKDIGPGTYFPNISRSSSVGLLRQQTNSSVKIQPSVSFTKCTRVVKKLKLSLDQTYDLKTNTIMAHYDFEYDGGKGLNSGTSWMKNRIQQSSKTPMEKNRMKSYSFGKENRCQKKGEFSGMMERKPAPLRIEHPKF